MRLVCRCEIEKLLQYSLDDDHCARETSQQLTESPTTCSSEAEDDAKRWAVAKQARSQSLDDLPQGLFFLAQLDILSTELIIGSSAQKSYEM